MGSYSLSETINNCTSSICNSYITYGFVRNQIIAAMIVTLITLFVAHYMKKKDSTKIFIVASLANMTYLFFHTYALSTYIKTKGDKSNLFTEFTGIYAVEGNSKDEFTPDTD